MKSRLAKSKFRSSFHLKPNDRQYFLTKGEAVIRSHAADLIRERLAPAKPRNDGKQTPFKGHPVFTAQHAVGACCRSCLEKWHGIPRERELSDNEIGYIIEMIMNWIKEDVN